MIIEIVSTWVRQPQGQRPPKQFAAEIGIDSFGHRQEPCRNRRRRLPRQKPTLSDGKPRKLLSHQRRQEPAGLGRLCLGQRQDDRAFCPKSHDRLVGASGELFGQGAVDQRQPIVEFHGRTIFEARSRTFFAHRLAFQV
ncbi:MAG: hypothetical protein B7Z73_04800 [Planctomycetia bacterium 21-64-5]|nr:MAG: hypothetical protein B7Z73_04800 [Planctomycetia bacterium 21-64-5]